MREGVVLGVDPDAYERIEDGEAKIAAGKYRAEDVYHDNPETCRAWPSSGTWRPIPTLESWGFERCGSCGEGADA